MNFNEAVDVVKEAKIAEETDFSFMAAVIILIGGYHDWDLDEIYKETNYGYDDVAKILENLYANEIIIDGKLQMEVHEKELNNVVELTLLALCGSGEVVRKKEDVKLNFFNTNKNTFDQMTNKKTLNDHLFDTLDRLSAADADNVNVEVDKAASIIRVSEQILNVAKLKLDIIQANIETSGHFSEIDINQDQKQIGGDESLKKKIQ